MGELRIEKTITLYNVWAMKGCAQEIDPYLIDPGEDLMDVDKDVLRQSFATNSDEEL